ncbi:MAG: DNA polymerase III subunit delta [Bdellovibrionales bacterium]|nr:DNA polymerase III subunit delta [Bdellovibrionales bacterium]
MSLKKGTVVYISGDEEFFVEEAVSYIKQQMLDEASRDFNFDLFYGRETEISKVHDVVETLPMMAQTRLVILRRAHDLRDQDWKVLLPAIEKPVPSTFFVMTGNKLDGRKSIIKQVTSHLASFHFAKPYDNEFPKWVQYICKKFGLTIENDAVQLLMQIVGPNLLEMQNEIQKLGQYIGERNDIRAGDVMTVASRIKLQSVFDLTKAIGQNDRARALMCLAQLLESGQNEVGIMSMIHRHIRLLRQTKMGEQQGFSGRQLSSFAGVPHFFLNEYSHQARLWSERKIERTYKVLCDTDRALKSSPVSSHIWLENFIMQTCH